MSNALPQPPADVEDQTEQILQACIAEMLFPVVVVDGELEDLLFWVGFQTEECCTLLCVFVRRRDGGLGRGVARQSATLVARNRLSNPAELPGGQMLDFPRLQMLERLALQSRDPDQQPMREAWLRMQDKE